MRAPDPPPVRFPIMIQHWRSVGFLHWPYPAELVQALLPPGLSVETFDGTAWLGIIPLLMDGVRPSVLPSLPWLSRFPEINLRSYVRGPDGRTGIWFFSLEAARLPAVALARAGFGLPYRWAGMSLRRDGDRVSYRSGRHTPARPVRCDIDLEFGAQLDQTRLAPFDHFVTARYRLYSVYAGRLVGADVWHRPWPLRRARLAGLRQDLITSLGLPAPEGDPVPHASDGVRARVGMWRPVRPR